MEENGANIMDTMDGKLEASDKPRDCKLENNDLEIPAESSKMDTGSSQNLSEVNPNRKKKKKRNKNKKKAMNKDDVQSMDPNKRDTGSTDNPETKMDTGSTDHPENKMGTGSIDNPETKMDQGSIDNPETKMDTGLTDNPETKMDTGLTDNPETKMDTASIDNPATGNVNAKRKRKRKKTKKKVKNRKEIESMDQEVGMLDLHLSDGRGIDGKRTENECTGQESGFSIRKEPSLSESVHDKENPLDLCKDEKTILSPDVVDLSTNGVSSELVEERVGHLLAPIEVEGKSFPSESQHNSQPNQITAEIAKIENGLNTINNEVVVDLGKCSAEGRRVLSTCDAEITKHLSSLGMKEAECLSKDLEHNPRIAPTASVKRKLLVLDVNGLLANIVFPAPKDCRGDTHILGRAIFKRPFCDDFLKFCFQNFDVGVWSSRSKRIIDRVVDYLLGDLTNQLLFCWDMSHSTQTGFKTLENIHKPLVCKELRRIWENDDPNLPWKKGDYDESNTLLLDDSPYKALLNPLHTAIFPNSYDYKDKNDKSLGPGGDLRVYLEGLLTSENVQTYVEQHPFGQSAINETNLSWGFYSGVLQAISNHVEDNTPTTMS